MDFAFTGEVWEWRGPSPYFFVTVPDEESAELKAVASSVTYGWGMIPAEIRIGQSVWTTALWPKDGGYVVPIKDKFRKAERLVLGERVAVTVVVRR